MAEVYACQVEVLDGSTVSIDVNKRAPADVLFNEVFKHLGLEETDYFGLQYFDNKGITHWLDPFKQLRKQVKRGPYNFRFRVKLYPISPTYLFEDSTRYFLSLQVKDDLLNQRLFCSDTTYALLSSYLVQGEYGDYDPVEHPAGYLNDFPFLEDMSIDFKQRVTELHKKNRGLLPAECDRRFLDVACRLEQYGMDMHLVTDISGIHLWMGVSSRGVTVFCGEDSYLVALNSFPWVRISAINFKWKSLMLEMVPLPGSNHIEVIAFNCPAKSACKALWKSCVEHHTFFRSIRALPEKRRSSISLFRRGSTFRYSGRTQFKLLQEGTEPGRRHSRRFERLTSRNRITRKTI